MKDVFYTVGYILENGNLTRQSRDLYRSHKWAQNHFEIFDVKWLWIEDGKMWIAQTEGWPRPVVSRVELRD